MNRKQRRRLAKSASSVAAGSGPGPASPAFDAGDALALLSGLVRQVRPAAVTLPEAAPAVPTERAPPVPSLDPQARDENIATTCYYLAMDALRGGRTPETLARAVAAVAAHADRLWAEARREVEAGDKPKIACKAGCGWCCHQTITVAPVEAVAIAAHVRDKFTAEARTALHQRLAAFVEQIGALSAAERARRQVPCSYLVDGACSIYEVRPLRCRGVHSRDVGHCIWRYEYPDAARTDGRSRVGAGPYVVESARIMNAALAGLARACRDLGLLVDSLDIEAATHAALDTPQVEARFLAGAPVFSGLIKGSQTA
ncbi:MAG: YkgJ family cysteine cluster protein [Proteobacteria bacterium]|nr:YkgJ family cysteine cluster protein [Pseudomonadota bacterium]